MSAEGENAKSMSIIVTKGTLDWAYPPFILATTAAAMDVKVTMFFTFYGLQLLKKTLIICRFLRWEIRRWRCR